MRNSEQRATTLITGMSYEGAPAGIPYDGEFVHIGSPAELMDAKKRTVPGDLVDVMYLNMTTQVVASERAIEAIEGLDDEVRQELVAFIEARLDVTTRLGVSCLEAAGVDTSYRSGISTVHNPGGPVVVDLNGCIYNHRMEK